MDNTKSWHGFSVSKKEWPKFREILIKENLMFEPSGCYDHIHVEIYCTLADAIRLDTIELPT